MTRQRKPYDVGNGMVCASFALDGSWLSVGVPHPKAGLVELTGAPTFPAECDGEVALVRAHRALLTDPASAMLRVVGARSEPADGDPVWQLQGDGWSARAEAWAETHSRVIAQRFLVRTAGGGALQIAFRGRLDRPGYAEITPGGPIPPSLPPTVLDCEAETLRLQAPLGVDDPVARIEITSPNLHVESWSVSREGASLRVSWKEALTDAQLLVTVTMTCGEPDMSPRTPRAGTSPPAVRAPAPTHRDTCPLDRIEAAAARYTLGCTALEVADGECCILTDHRLLPLSWTRDAYYQAALLLAHTQDLPQAGPVVERHLAWLWRSGRDGVGVWRRSHLTTGAVKDSAYQVDQQLFPILELVDYRRTTGRWPTDPQDGWGNEVRRVWDGLPRDESGLVPGDENPADDPSALPYLLSSQLLLAYVARRLGEYETELGIEDIRMDEDAIRTLDIVWSTFTCPGPFGDQLAYEADGLDDYRLYHDANDIPTALAPLWGLCTADDPHWRATMRFAFSDHNPGFVTGAPGGLGSAHTPGIWPLGDAQEWAVAVATGDQARVAAIIERIEFAASADGMLPETYRGETGEWLARHWFAWPGSLVGLLHATFHEGRGPWAKMDR